MADHTVIEAVISTLVDLQVDPGMTPLSDAAIRQLYEDQHCPVYLQMVDAKLVAASTDAMYLWWGFMLGCVVALLVAILIIRVMTWRSR